MAENKEVIILDTSALLAYIEDEDGADYAEDLLIKAEHNEITIYIAFVSLTEVMYVAHPVPWTQDKTYAAAFS